MEINKEDRKRLEEVNLSHPLVKAIITLNREVGIIQGELVWIRRLMTATVVAAVGQLFYSIFGG